MFTDIQLWSIKAFPYYWINPQKLSYFSLCSLSKARVLKLRKTVSKRFCFNINKTKHPDGRKCINGLQAVFSFSGSTRVISGCEGWSHPYYLGSQLSAYFTSFFSLTSLWEQNSCKNRKANMKYLKTVA